VSADLGELPSPALVVDLDVFEANLAAARRLLEGTGTRLRPHVKTHRTPGLALWQLGGGVVGVTCATVGEAEVMAQAGIEDLLVANEVVSPGKLARLAELARQARVGVAVDSRAGVEALGAAARAAGSQVEVLVDVDVGLGRCGVATPEAARELAATVERTGGLRLAGIMGYEGRLRAEPGTGGHPGGPGAGSPGTGDAGGPAGPGAGSPGTGDAGGQGERARLLGRAHELLASTAEALRRAGLEAGVVSSGGTSTLREAAADPTVTEIQAGTYALMEPDLDGLGLPFHQATAVWATVISRAPGRVVLDAGRKSLACDRGLPALIGGGGRVQDVNEEHTIVAWRDGQPPIGARVGLRPGHVPLTFNLHGTVWLARGDAVVDQLPVAARECSR
jgi:D-serine deaminase-like pyridoxal phosphate-dependent protein